MPSSRSPIGVFDSGVGGLTVLRSLMSLLPRERFIYVGDTARVPYGTKSAESVRRFALEIAGFLTRRGVKMIVVACNTVSAVALPELRRAMKVPVLGVIEPGARAALAATRGGRVGVIGTQATVRSRAYEEAVRRLDPTVRVFSQACPLLVPLVEEGWLRHPVTRSVASLYLKPLLRKGIDTLVLGCTHYPLLKRTLAAAARRVELIDSADETAKAVRSRLEQDGMLSHGRPAGSGEAARARRRGNRAARRQHEFYSSDDPAKFENLGRRFLGGKLRRAKRIELEGV